MSLAVMLPDSTSLFISSTVMPIPAAAACSAPGNASPSCPLSSSAWTVPLLAIWESAIKAFDVSALLLPALPMALDTASNTSRVA